MGTLLWLVTLVGALVGATLALTSLPTATGAPQEAAIMAVAIGMAVIPYVLARSWQELTGSRGKKP